MRIRALVAIALAVAISSKAQADDWPQFLGRNRDGVSNETGLLRSWGKDGPKVLWKKDVGEGFSGPIIAGDRLIVFHRVGDEEWIECWNAADGKPQWKHAYPTSYQDPLGKGDGPRATPLIDGKRVVTMGGDGDLTCLDLANGAKVWARKITKDYTVPQSYFGIGSSPAVDDGLVLVNVGAKDAGIVAFRLEDGKEVWKATGDGASYSSPVIRAIDGVKHAIFFTRNGPVILDPKNGSVRHQERWRARYDASVNAATPLVFGDRAFFSASYETGALMLRLIKTGAEQLWTSDSLMSNHYNTCVYHKEHLFGIDGRQEAGPSLRCVDPKNRAVTWDQKRFGCASMILAEGNLMILTERGELVLVAAVPEKYIELARAKVMDAGPVRAQIALANGRLFARDQRHLYCFDMKK
ncbi:MAG: PQQ-like beta-propeller repeat protein [Planctomycetes bacterium]|nr:PQQ-like beta-propeller repeat protein [Planctomycetota bacterium]